MFILIASDSLGLLERLNSFKENIMRFIFPAYFLIMYDYHYIQLSSTFSSTLVHSVILLLLLARLQFS